MTKVASVGQLSFDIIRVTAGSTTTTATARNRSTLYVANGRAIHALEMRPISLRWSSFGPALRRPAGRRPAPATYRTLHHCGAAYVAKGADGRLRSEKLDVLVGGPQDAYVVIDRAVGLAIVPPEAAHSHPGRVKVPLVLHHDTQHFAHASTTYPRIVLDQDLPRQSGSATSPSTLWLWGATSAITLDGTADEAFEESCRESSHRLSGAATLLKDR